MSLSGGTRLGPYQIVSLLGTGGMGEVYRAHDTKLLRDVAIKVLPDAVAGDPERLARFEREAQVLAALNDPHIAHIHGFEDSTSVPALVMELVEGPTLAERVATGPIPLNEALPIARQIAEALEAAHETGIIHRDLKPANIKVKDDGTVKVLDFGLAKALEPAATFSGTESPTITTPAMMTGVGIILGTAAYMSPEQAKGRPADKRSDLWAFGCVLYEMLTGARAFEGDDVGDTLANVLKAEPDWTVLPAATPTSIRRLLRRCLIKDRRRRLSDAAVARLEVDDSSIEEGSKAREPASAMSRAVHVAWAVTAIVMIGVGALAAWMIGGRPAAPAQVVRFRVTLPEGANYNAPPTQSLAVSPDGESIILGRPLGLVAYSLADDDARTILTTRVFPSTPIVSPDGRSVAFFRNNATLAQHMLEQVAAAGGPAVTLAQGLDPAFGASWSDSGIVFGTRAKGVIRVPVPGGTPEVIAAPLHGEVMESPEVLPGGDALLVTVAAPLLGPRETPSAGLPTADWDHADVIVQSLKTGRRTTLIRGAADARYAPSGHLIFVRGGVLFAAPFDLRHLTIGAAVPVVPGVQRATVTGAALFAFSRNGTLAYIPGPPNGASTIGATLAWTTTTGAVERLDVPAGTYETPRIAPNGRRAAVTYTDSSGSNVWTVDLSGAHSMSRLTFGGRNRCPVWSPDGERIVFQSDRSGDAGLYSQPADHGTASQLTKAAPGVEQIPESWEPNGKHLLFSSTDGTGVTLWALSLETGAVAPFGNIHSTQPINAVFSPDGRWVAYGSNESGTPTVYVQPFPATGEIYQVSRGDIGHHPVWSRDGKRILYIPQAGQLVSVTVTTESGFSVTSPTPVPRGFTIGNAQTQLRNHDIAKDGRLLGIVLAGQDKDTTTPQITVVLNWFEDLKARAPAK